MAKRTYKKTAWTADGSDITPLAERVMDVVNQFYEGGGASDPGYQSALDSIKKGISDFVMQITQADVDVLEDYNYHIGNTAIAQLNPAFATYDEMKYAKTAQSEALKVGDAVITPSGAGVIDELDDLGLHAFVKYPDGSRWGWNLQELMKDTTKTAQNEPYITLNFDCPKCGAKVSHAKTTNAIVCLSCLSQWKDIEAYFAAGGAKSKTSALVDDLLNEHINAGGVLVTRGEYMQYLQKNFPDMVGKPFGPDYLAMSPRALSPDEVAAWPDVLKGVDKLGQVARPCPECGAKMDDGQTCPSCGYSAPDWLVEELNKTAQTDTMVYYTRAFWAQDYDTKRWRNPTDFETTYDFPPRTEYDLVGSIPATNPEQAWEIMNIGDHGGYSVRSMSVGDVVVIGGKAYIAKDFGFGEYPNFIGRSAKVAQTIDVSTENRYHTPLCPECDSGVLRPVDSDGEPIDSFDSPSFDGFECDECGYFTDDVRTARSRTASNWIEDRPQCLICDKPAEVRLLDFPGQYYCEEHATDDFEWLTEDGDAPTEKTAQSSVPFYCPECGFEELVVEELEIPFSDDDWGMVQTVYCPDCGWSSEQRTAQYSGDEFASDDITSGSVEVACDECDGTGVCQTCLGAGCSWCNESGDCLACDGAGVIYEP